MGDSEQFAELRVITEGLHALNLYSELRPGLKRPLFFIMFGIFLFKKRSIIKLKSKPRNRRRGRSVRSQGTCLQAPSHADAPPSTER